MQLAGAHDSGDSLPVGWRSLSVHGTLDGTSTTKAEMFHLRHKVEGHKLRVIEGASRAFVSEVATVAMTLNDWFEGARRLTSDDVSLWKLRDDRQALQAAAQKAEEDEDELQMV